MPGFWPFKRNDGDSSLIEGISDDTLLFIFIVAGLIGLWIYYSRRNRAVTIHPDNRQDVELLRQRNEGRGGDAASSSRRGRSGQDTCPICLVEPTVFTVETNCGHVFCGKCLISFWKFQSNWMSGLKCPVCRQQITVLLTHFTAEERLSPNVTDQQMVATSVKDFNRRFSGAPRTWSEYFHDIPVLIPHIIHQMFSAEGLSLAYRIRSIIIFISVIAYVISPLDIFPESILGIFGLVDDFLIVICATLYFIVAFRQTLAQG